MKTAFRRSIGTLCIGIIAGCYLQAGETSPVGSSLQKEVRGGLHESKDKATRFDRDLPADGKSHHYEAVIRANGIMEHANVAAVDAEMRWSNPTRYQDVAIAIFKGSITAETREDGGYYSKFWGKMKAQGHGGDGGTPGDLTWDFFGKLNMTGIQDEILRWTAVRKAFRRLWANSNPGKPPYPDGAPWDPKKYAREQGGYIVRNRKTGEVSVHEYSANKDNRDSDYIKADHITWIPRQGKSILLMMMTGLMKSSLPCILTPIWMISFL